VDATLQRLVEMARAIVPGCRHAGVTVLRRGRPETPAATDEVSAEVDRIQYETGEGPCLSAVLERPTYRTGDLSAETRWPRFSGPAAERTGVLSVLAYRLFAEGDTLGALDLYSRERDGFDDEAEAIGTILAAYAALAFARAREREQISGLEQAVASNRSIGMAIGILMAIRRVGQDEAFDFLRTVSQRTNRKLREIADEVVHTGQLRGRHPTELRKDHCGGGRRCLRSDFTTPGSRDGVRRCSRRTVRTAMSLWHVFFSEVAGTSMLLLLGCGVVANVLLAGSKGFGGGWLLINFGWGLGVFAGVYVAFKSGAHLNPAVTLGLLANGVNQYAPGVDVNFGSTVVYLCGEMVGAFLGAVLAWLAYREHFDTTDDPALQLAVFSTGPAIRDYTWNLITEIIATFVLVFVILFFGSTPSGLGPLAVSLLVVGIGASLGGPTGYAINPARDLGPRIAHALLPIKGKGNSDWGYSWVPVVGPIIGGVIAGLLARAFI